MDDLKGIVAFIREAEGLKSCLRTAWTSSGRRESTAEHSWRLALLALALWGRYPELDGAKLLGLCIVHDLGELYGGDISAALLPDPEEKEAAEREGIRRALAPLPGPERRRLLALWEEYAACATAEARLVKALDKAETILQHSQGANPPDFDYGFNLDYGRAYFTEDDTLRGLRGLLDLETEKRRNGHGDSGAGP